MMLNKEDQIKSFVQSAPVPVYFAGFRSDTMALQGAGWQFSIDQQMMIEYGEIHIYVAAKNEAVGQMMWFNPIRVPRGELYHSLMSEGFVKDMELHAQFLAPRIQARIMPMQVSSLAMRPADMRPEVSYMPEKEVNIEEFAMFKPINVSEDFEIYLNKKDETEILDLLLQKQDPKQKEIRENRRHRAWKDSYNGVDKPKGYNPYGDISRQLVVVS